MVNEITRENQLFCGLLAILGGVGIWDESYSSGKPRTTLLMFSSLDFGWGLTVQAGGPSYSYSRKVSFRQDLQVKWFSCLEDPIQLCSGYLIKRERMISKLTTSLRIWIYELTANFVLLFWILIYESLCNYCFVFSSCQWITFLFL